MAIVRVERSLIPFKVTRTPVPVGHQEHHLVLGHIHVVAEDQVAVSGHTLFGLPLISGGTYTQTEIAANTMSWGLPCKTIVFEWQPSPSDA